METWIDKALSLGFTQAVALEGLSLHSEETFREYCAACPNQGQNWVCPPGCGTLAACGERLAGFDRGILLRSVTELEPPVPMETYAALGREHNLRLAKLLEELKGEGELLALTTGGCVFCDRCAYPEPCVRPEVKMESLSAFGIDVGKLSRDAGVDYSFREDRLYMTALVLRK